MEILDMLNRFSDPPEGLFGTKRFILVVADLWMFQMWRWATDTQRSRDKPPVQFVLNPQSEACPLPSGDVHTPWWGGGLHPRAWTHTSRDNICTAHSTSLEYVFSNKAVLYVLMGIILGSSQFDFTSQPFSSLTSLHQLLSSSLLQSGDELRGQNRKYTFQNPFSGWNMFKLWVKVSLKLVLSLC